MHNLAARPIASRIYIRNLIAFLVVSVHDVSRNHLNALPDYKGIAMSSDTPVRINKTLSSFGGCQRLNETR